MPIDGGMLDQTQAFYAAVEYIDLAHGIYRREQELKTERAKAFKRAIDGNQNARKRTGKG